MEGKQRGKGAAALLLCAGLVSLASGCAKEKGLEGNIQLVGSTSMEEMCSGLSEAYMEKQPGVTVSAEYVGSTAGMEALLGGSADIGTSSRNLTQEEKDAGAAENIVAKDGYSRGDRPHIGTDHRYLPRRNYQLE